MKIHIVKKGDTLFELSKKYNVPLQKIVDANPQITNLDQLTIGEKVKIPAVAVPVGGGGEQANTYKHVVKQGDTLWKLSKAWGLPLQSLIAANPQLADPNQLKVGDIVNIPAGSGDTPGTPAITNPHAGHSSIIEAESQVVKKKNTAPIAGAQMNEPGNVMAEGIQPKPLKKKPTMEMPTEVPAPQPAPMEAPKQEAVQVMPPKQEPVNVQPPNQEPVHIELPVEIKIEVEQIQYESTKLQPINIQPTPYEPVKTEPVKYEPIKVEPPKVEPMKYEPMKYEPMKYEPMMYEPMKHEPMKYEPMMYEPMKHEPMKYEPMMYEPMMYEPMKHESMKSDPTYDSMMYEPMNVGPMMHEPAKYEELPSLPQPEYPNLPYPQYYQVEQPPAILPAMEYPSSPCGCSGPAPYPYQQPESQHLFYQYQVPAEKVSSYYDFPEPHHEQAMMYLGSMASEYPGISASPAYQMPEMGGMMNPMENAAYPHYGHQPYTASQPAHAFPEMYGNAPFPQEMSWQHPGYDYHPSYSSPMSSYGAPFAYPQAPSVPGPAMAVGGLMTPELPMMPEAAKGEIGGLENMKGYLERDLKGEGTAEISVESVDPGIIETYPQDTKDVKISANEPEKKGRSKKQTKATLEASSKKERHGGTKEKAVGRSNPWIND
ncbi:LysM peptidoglycan-binding domain-containing protein [Paenibacillus puldeungensis]